MFLKGSPQGDLLLREAIRDYLHAARGVNCTAEQIIIGAGNEYLLILLSQLLGRETGIAMEDPTYKQAYRVLGGMGHPVFPVGMDDSGFRVQELERLPASAAYVMPSHQFPMGIVMPVAVKKGEYAGLHLLLTDKKKQKRREVAGGVCETCGGKGLRSVFPSDPGGEGGGGAYCNPGVCDAQ